MIARSHYGDSIDLDTMSLGYALGYEDEELEEIETAVAPLGGVSLVHDHSVGP
jgi:hypothetical protein